MGNFINVPEIFGIDVFNETAMRQHLKPEIYDAWKNCIQNGTALELNVANEIAEAMKNWAVEKVPANDRNHRRKTRCLY